MPRRIGEEGRTRRGDFARRYGVNITGERAWLWVGSFWRVLTRSLYRLAGFLKRVVTFGGLAPVVGVLAGVVAFLFLTPIVLHGVVWVLDRIGAVFERWGVEADLGVAPAPDVKVWLTPQNIALFFFAGVLLRWFARARKRVIVETFIDHTKEDATAVSGLSTLLVTELTRLRQLYGQVTAEAVPEAVGVETQGGFARGKEAAPFLTVSADSVSDMLEGAVASDARLEIGPAKIPIGPLLGMLNRVARGPRVVGSVHRTEAGGGPTLTAQLVGVKPAGTWRVDQEQVPESAEERKAFLDTMVRELACRMFTELTLGATVRWQAAQAFNDYLRLYGDSKHTPRDRAGLLKRAQGKLLEAIAEDETFDLAYYNLGVIYTELAHEELEAERSYDDLDSPAGVQGHVLNGAREHGGDPALERASVPRHALDDARKQAADAAFESATQKKPDRWEGHYALAVTRLSTMKTLDIDQWPDEEDAQALKDVIRRCQQALAVKPSNAAKATVFDLRGMAETRLGEFRRARTYHRRAVRRAWKELCRAERDWHARPEGNADRLERARANAAAALHNMALARARQGEAALLPEKVRFRRVVAFALRRDRLAAGRIFHNAIRVAGDGTAPAAASYFERGRVLEKSRKFKAADKAFKKAELIHPDNCEYTACRARTLAEWSVSRKLAPERLKVRRELADSHAMRAFDDLARHFARSVLPYTPPALDARCDATLDALAQTFETLDPPPLTTTTRERGFGAAEADRFRKIKRLRRVLEKLSDPKTGVNRSSDDRVDWIAQELERLQRWARMRGAQPDRRGDWELTQVELALARRYAVKESWPKACGTINAILTREGFHANVTHRVGLDLRAMKACALRNIAKQEATLETQRQKLVTALDTAAESVRRDPLSIQGRREAGRAHFALRQYDDALDAWRHALFLNPSDAYLHFEIGRCHWQRADQRRGDERATSLGDAEDEFGKALALFDGEDFDGEAWTRVWLGRVALERNRIHDAICQLEAGTHATAAPAAHLFLAEALLRANRHSAAIQEAERAAALFASASEDRKHAIRRWANDLESHAVNARLERMRAEASYVAPCDWHDWPDLWQAWRQLRNAQRHTTKICDEAARDDCRALVLQSKANVLRALKRYHKALAESRKRLQLKPGSDDFMLEAELLELLAASSRRRARGRELLLAAERAWHSADVNSPSVNAVGGTQQSREQLKRALNGVP